MAATQDDDAKRVEMLLESDGTGAMPPKITGYKVMALWSDVPGKDVSVPHGIGDVLKPGDVVIPDGHERGEHIATLVAIGLLQPVYEKGTPVEDKQAALAQAQAGVPAQVLTPIVPQPIQKPE